MEAEGRLSWKEGELGHGGDLQLETPADLVESYAEEQKPLKESFQALLQGGGQ